MSLVRISRCPRCGKSVPLTEKNSWRPFCSERCQTVDLGNWFSERHRLPVEDENSSQVNNPDISPLD